MWWALLHYIIKHWQRFSVALRWTFVLYAQIHIAVILTTVASFLLEEIKRQTTVCQVTLDLYYCSAEELPYRGQTRKNKSIVWLQRVRTFSITSQGYSGENQACSGSDSMHHQNCIRELREWKQHPTAHNYYSFPDVHLSPNSNLRRLQLRITLGTLSQMDPHYLVCTTMVMYNYAFHPGPSNLIYTWYLIIKYFTQIMQWCTFAYTCIHQHRISVAAHNMAGPGPNSTTKGSTGNRGSRISYWGWFVISDIVLSTLLNYICWYKYDRGFDKNLLL